MKKILKDIERLVNIDSVYSESDKYPFGEGVDKVLTEATNMFNEYGFKAYRDPNGYYGYADLGDTSDAFGIIFHLDVVPVVRKYWNSDPFKMKVDDEFIYGRGVQDDKGPGVICLHAINDLVEEGYELKRGVRFIYGTDEESYWRGIDKYKEDKNLIPTAAITPDSKFPLIYAEKGLLQLRLKSNNSSSFNLKAGSAFNVVPGEVKLDKIEDSLKAELNKLGIETKVEEGKVVVLGKGVHSASSDKGINAIVYLLKAMKNNGISTDAIEFVNEFLFDGVKGNKIFEVNSDKESGFMTVNLGLVDLNENYQELCIDIRHPVTFKLNDVVNGFKSKASKYNFEVEVDDYLAPLYVDKEGELVQELMAAYSSVTGDKESQPEISGGATYARAMDNCVAFGAIPVGSEKTEHQPNERVKLKDIQLAYDIYKEAFKRLIFKEK